MCIEKAGKAQIINKLREVLCGVVVEAHNLAHTNTESITNAITLLLEQTFHLCVYTNIHHQLHYTFARINLSPLCVQMSCAGN